MYQKHARHKNQHEIERKANIVVIQLFIAAGC